MVEKMEDEHKAERGLGASVGSDMAGVPGGEVRVLSDDDVVEREGAIFGDNGGVKICSPLWKECSYMLLPLLPLLPWLE